MNYCRQLRSSHNLFLSLGLISGSDALIRTFSITGRKQKMSCKYHSFKANVPFLHPLKKSEKL